MLPGGILRAVVGAVVKGVTVPVAEVIDPLLEIRTWPPLGRATGLPAGTVNMLLVVVLRVTFVPDPALKLTAFVEVGAPDLNHLFVPFSDLTSGTETYPAGRYIDLSRNPTGVYELDFNRAYHPYCYYNASYECPYPPAENRLPLPVHAGERLRRSEKF